MKSLFLTFLLLSAALLSAQNVRVDGTVFQRNGIPSPGASVAVCSQPANTSFTPCSPLVQLCSSITDGTCTQPNPTTTDGLGNYFFYVAPGLYTYQFYGTNLTTRVLPDQQVGTGVTPPPSTIMLSLDRSSVDCGNAQINVTTSCQTVTVTNTGTTNVSVTNITSSDSHFTPDQNSCQQALVPNDTCSFLVDVRPTIPGPLSATITVTSTAPVDPQNPLTVSATANGTSTGTFNISVPGFGTGGGSVSDGGSFNPTYATGGACISACSINYPTGTVVTLTATAAPGSVFAGFNGTGLTFSPPSSVTFTVSQNQTIPVTFNQIPPDVTLTLASTGQGGGIFLSDVPADNGSGVLNCAANAGVLTPQGSSGCNGPFMPGTVVTLTATPNGSSTFVSWTGAPGCTTSTTCAVTMNSDVTVTANFASSSSFVQLSLTQVSTNCAVSGATIACNWLSPQLAGDTNICAGTWPDNTTTVSSIADTGLNTYTQVPTISPKTTTGLTQVLYYAQNITAASAGARTTTMTLSSSAASAVAGTSLTSAHNNGTATTYTTASVTATSNNLILATFWAQLNSGNGPGAISSVADTGCGLTWQLVQALNFNSGIGTGTTTRIETWRTLGNGSSCTVTATWGISVVGRGASISKFSGVDTSGSNGSGAIGIAATNTGAGNTNATLTMGTFGSAANGTFGVVGTGSGASRTQGTGMTLLGADTLVSDEWAAGNVSPVFETLGANQAWGVIGIEIKASGSAGRRDMRCLEYAGVKQSGSPIDVSAAAVGSSAAPSSGGVTTGTANDLLTGFTASSTSVNAVSSGYTQRAKNTFGDDEEDQEGIPIATYPFAPSLTSSGNWIASQVAWLAQSTSAPTVFSLTLLPNAGNGSGVVSSNIGTPALGGLVSPNGCLASPNSGCSSAVPANSSVTLTATASQGAVFVSWVGITGCSTSPVCILQSITSNQNIVANFVLSGSQTYYVSASGNDNNAGTSQASPWRTFSHAASAAQIGASGTTVIFSPANYNENVTLSKGGSSTTARLVFRCSTAWTVGGSNCKMVNINTRNVNNVDIGALGELGFELTNPGGQTAIDDIANNCNTGSGACNVGNSIHILGNYIHDVATGGCPSSGAIATGQHGRQQTDIQAIGNLIDNVATGASCSLMHGIYIVSPGAKIQNNVILRVAGGAIQYYDESCSGVVSNNTLLNGHFGIISYGSNGCTAGLNTYANNIIDNMTGAAFYNGFSSAGDCSSGKNSLFSNNMLNGNGAQWQQAQPACEIRQNTITTEAASATFVSYTGTASGNYQLKGTSIAINGGTAQCVTGGQNPCISPVDILNVSRPQRANFDIGAYELP